jgi:hypothetical protein
MSHPSHSSPSALSLKKELEDLNRKIAEAEKTGSEHVHALQKRAHEVTEQLARLSS